MESCSLTEPESLTPAVPLSKTRGTKKDAWNHTNRYADLKTKITTMTEFSTEKRNHWMILPEVKSSPFQGVPVDDHNPTVYEIDSSEDERAWEEFRRDRLKDKSRSGCVDANSNEEFHRGRLDDKSRSGFVVDANSNEEFNRDRLEEKSRSGCVDANSNEEFHRGRLEEKSRIGCVVDANSNEEFRRDRLSLKKKSRRGSCVDANSNEDVFEFKGDLLSDNSTTIDGQKSTTQEHVIHKKCDENEQLKKKNREERNSQPEFLLSIAEKTRLRKRNNQTLIYNEMSFSSDDDIGKKKTKKAKRKKKSSCKQKVQNNAVRDLIQDYDQNNNCNSGSKITTCKTSSSKPSTRKISTNKPSSKSSGKSSSKTSSKPSLKKSQGTTQEPLLLKIPRAKLTKYYFS